jgi:uncharacterized protein YydD (DUF2326 family)
MIYSVGCDRPSFKSVRFRPGFNVVLAERTKESDTKDSRNGLGKTTLIEIIHFCLGANTKAGEGLLREPLLGWTFSLELELRNRRYRVYRNTERPKHIAVEGDFAIWPKKPDYDTKTGESILPIRDWNMMLGWLMFDLPASARDDAYNPTFRSMISYFARKGRDAFSSPFEHVRKQQEWDKQVNNAYLLGLNWDYAREWQNLKEQASTLKHLKKAAGSGLMSNLMGTIGELEAQKIRLEEQVAHNQEQLNSFKVLPQYRDIEKKATELTAAIHKFVNENVSDKRLLDYYESSIRDEQPVAQDNIQQIYKEAGVLLPGHVTKRLEDVQAFHSKIVANRKNYLQSEITRLNDAISAREKNISKLSEERSSLLTILKTHGALEEYTKLQQLHLRTVSQLEDLKKRIDNLKKFEQGSSALKIDQQKLQMKTRSDYEERVAIREKAVSIFNANSEGLYKSPGNLIVNIGKSGYTFDIKIERGPSQGVEQMNVFCYDLMMAQLWAGNKTQPGVLVHDSTIFDGVDERQIAHALQLAAQASEKYGFQYIC